VFLNKKSKNSFMEANGYFISEMPFSKKISECMSGLIVKDKDKKILLLNFPDLSLNEEKMFNSALNELKRSKIKVTSKGDIVLKI
jgi:hypothetical protein